MISAVAYLRVSTERQASEERTSLADQEAATHALAARLGVHVGRIFKDAGASGATVQGRPAFRELLAWCEENRRPARAPGHVLVLNDSRLGRFEDPEEAAYWRHHLARLGWIVRFAEGDEVQGDFRTVVRAIGSVQASEYRRTLIANTRRGKAGGARLGFWVSGRAPFGYRRRVVYPAGVERVLEQGQAKAPNEKVRLLPHAEEAETVRWIFEAYATGEHSLGSLADELHRRAPGRRWGRTVLNHLLRNDVYRGAVVGGRRRNAPSDLYACEGAHPALVTPELWQAVQTRLSTNAGRGPGVRSTYLLGGLLRCTVCGFPYHGGGHGGKPRAAGDEAPRYYRDSGAAALGGPCPGKIGAVARQLIDGAVLELMAKTLAAPAVRRRIERAIDAAIEAAPARVGQEETTLLAARARAEHRIGRLTDAVADGTLLAAEAAPKLAEARQALADAEAALQALRFAKGRARGLDAERERILQTVTDFPALAARAEPGRLRRLIEPWLQRATFDKETRVLTLGILPLPALGLIGSPALTAQTQGLIVRTASLVNPRTRPAARRAHG